ncbi:chorismate--pyruvate lyase family protein [Methanotorris igneus]|nr:chorismate pyruvate-lyase family protein [Methanotorris igneus]
MKIYERIRELSRKYGLRNEEKMILGTDGSVTNLLEILFEGDVIVKTINQKIVDDVNYRTVILEVNDIPLVYATSKTPFKNIEHGLRESIKRDLLSADIPIGRILKMHNLETRREIIDIDVKEVDKEVRKLLKTDRKILPQRTYNIIHNNKILMQITEIFNVGEHL